MVQNGQGRHVFTTEQHKMTKKWSNEQQHYIKLHQINTICCKVWPKNKMPINRHKVTKRMSYGQNGNGMATKKSSLQTEKWVCIIHN